MADAAFDGATGDVVRIAARAFERDRYLAALLSPREVRDDLIALAAFAGEVARIPAAVSEPMIGEIRLQWWRDVVESFEAGTPAETGHPIADALGRVVQRHELPPRLLLGVIDAYSERLQDEPFIDLDALTDNLTKLDGGLFELAHAIISRPDDRAAPPLLLDCGIVYGLSRVLVEAPAELAQGRMLLPADLMSTQGLSLASIADPQKTMARRAFSKALESLVYERLLPLSASYQVASRAVRLAVLPIALVRPYLRASQRSDIAALDVRDIGPMTRVWRLWLAHMTGRI